MKKVYYLLLIALLVSCHEELENAQISGNAVELTHVEAIIAGGQQTRTRADGDSNPVYLQEHISRFRFVENDQMTFTKVQRTEYPIPRFTYKDISFQHNASGAWDRDKGTGNDGENGTAPVRIYWSDAKSPHTFIGYSLPNVKSLLKDESAVFDWTPDGDVYYGSIGKPNENTQINYNPTSTEEDEYTVKENNVDVPKSVPISSLMRAEDVLLAFDEDVVADASVAHVKFYHGLSSIKVRVMLSDFYGSELDGYTKVDNMVLKHQPTLYKWDQKRYKTSAKVTGTETHEKNNPRDMLLWDYKPDGEGTNAGKTFTFYGITVPQEAGYDFQDLVLTFRVRYPNPLKADLTKLKTDKTYTIPENAWLEKTYTATIPKGDAEHPTPVYFHPNQCTIINIKLNHRDETMTIGAQYTDWEFVPSPDEGELKKNSTFLQSAPNFVADENSRKVTIAKDSKATEDDATWLYYKKNPDGSYATGSDDGKVLLDIYGNTGTKEKPYTISTANQLLSLAYEVSNGEHDFSGKYIKLDADITMQKDVDSENVRWLGIGTADKAFQGTFLGSGRKISRLAGAPLFNYVGNNAMIDNVTIENPLVGPETIVENKQTKPNPNYQKLLTGNAALVQNNAGVICGCRVNGDVGCAGTGNVGSLVGTNSGTIFACHHTGLVKGSGDVAGLVGTNTGSILFSYHAGILEGTAKYGIAPSSGTITDCYYDNKLAPSVTEVTGATGKTTSEMQKRSFVDDVYTAQEADDLNKTNLVKDKNDVEPDHDGYITTYTSGYTPVTEGDPKPSSISANSLNGKIYIWQNGEGSSNAHKTHFQNHSYLYQPATYPKVQ